MDKKSQFIVEVQTGVILKRLGDGIGPENSMWQGLINMDDAFYAADRIPDNVTAHAAACQFLEFIFKMNKENHYETWFFRS